MNSRAIVGVALTGMTVLFACTQDQSLAPSLPTEASSARAGSTPTCSFSTINAYAKSYFTFSTGQTKDGVFALIDEMQKDYVAGGNDGATSAGFDVLGRIGTATGTTAVKTESEAQGSLLVNNVLLCMTVPGFAYKANQFVTFLAPSTGLFGVAIDDEAVADDALPIVARSGRFGVEATDGDWPLGGSPSRKALFYGAPKNVGATFANDTRVGTVAEIHSLPSPLTFDPGIRVGFCDLGEGSDNSRILHLHGNTSVVLQVSNPTFCGAFTSSEAPSSMLAAAAARVGSWLAPKPLHAASRSMMFALIGGGTVRGLSDLGPIGFEDTLIVYVPDAAVSDTALASDDDPTTAQFKSLYVRAVTKQGENALAGVLVKLDVVGNKGGYLFDGEEATTDEQGYARFPAFWINKPGGYTLTATAAEFDPAAVTVSNLFNVSGQ